MLRDFILISILICAACSLLFRQEKCYHQKCEITQGNYTECDQEKYRCSRWNDTSFRSTGRCKYWGSPSINGYIYCDTTETCTSDPVTGQAVCEPNRKHFTAIPTVHPHPTEIGTDSGTDDIFHHAKSLMSSTVEFVLIGIGAAIFVVVVACVAVCRSTGEGCFKNQPRRLQRLDSLQSPLVENVEVEPITNPTELAVHPVTQYPNTSHPPAQIEYASQISSHFPSQCTESQYPAQCTAQYPASQYPAAQYPGAQYPGAQYPAAQYPGAQYPAAQYPGSNPENPPGYPCTQHPQSTQILQPSASVQVPPIVTSPSPAKNTPAEVTKDQAKKTTSKKTSAQTTHNHGPSASDAHHGGYAPPPSGTLTPGAVVRLTSKAHGKNLRIHQNGQIDGRGGTGQWATFMVHARGPYIALSLQDYPNKFLAIKNNSLTHGTGGKFCSLIVKQHPDGTVSLESAEHRTQHVGILPNGDPKGPHHTGTGDHGKFYVN